MGFSGLAGKFMTGLVIHGLKKAPHNAHNAHKPQKIQVFARKYAVGVFFSVISLVVH
jgi:phosphatidylserine decarboxylase